MSRTVDNPLSAILGYVTDSSDPSVPDGNMDGRGFTLPPYVTKHQIVHTLHPFRYRGDPAASRRPNRTVTAYSHPATAN